jgi:hypothetical protein
LKYLPCQPTLLLITAKKRGEEIEADEEKKSRRPKEINLFVLKKIIIKTIIKNNFDI